ncbi:MAG TPA: undecaprenyl-diphosphatase UppP [Syntrophomonadaceae bacterium]|nr:undecaprenyl-diphosphatase UppP [Syntrophomonadaceae bacterium]
MTIWQAVVMGIVQGLGEFLPISSSAHLVLVPWLFKWHDPGLTFDIALHIGTLIAVIAYFWRDWVKLIMGAFQGTKTVEGRLFWYLVLATIPGAIMGLLLEEKAETVFRNPILIAVMLIVLGVILYWADRKGKKLTDINNISLGQSLMIGISQALAIIPGVSRSGITMTTGLLFGLTREGAARFSFLLSAPVIFGAGLIKVPDILANPGMVDAPFLIGMLVSALSGAASIGFLLKYVQKKNFLPFVWYRFLLGAVVLLVALMRWM